MTGGLAPFAQGGVQRGFAPLPGAWGCPPDSKAYLGGRVGRETSPALLPYARHASRATAGTNVSSSGAGNVTTRPCSADR